jgi:hypothetical protein
MLSHHEMENKRVQLAFQDSVVLHPVRFKVWILGFNQVTRVNFFL